MERIKAVQITIAHVKPSLTATHIMYRKRSLRASALGDALFFACYLFIMTRRFIYLDESGDLGWSFNCPYRNGGSSRHITISAISISQDECHLLKRIIKKLYSRFNWPANIEKKWSGMNQDERLAFAKEARKLVCNNPDIKYLSITVKKEKVFDHIRRDPNKLYNYMISLFLLNEMSLHQEVHFSPDARSVKVSSGNSLHDYLQTQLWFLQSA